MVGRCRCRSLTANCQHGAQHTFIRTAYLFISYSKYPSPHVSDCRIVCMFHADCDMRMADWMIDWLAAGGVRRTRARSFNAETERRSECILSFLFFFFGPNKNHNNLWNNELIIRHITLIVTYFFSLSLYNLFNTVGYSLQSTRTHDV